MQRRLRMPLLAIALAAATASSPGLAKEVTGQVDARTFAGAFLAARSAEIDNDLASAIGFYRNALSHDRDNQELMQSMMLALIAEGRLDEALPYADKLRDRPEAGQFARLALAVDAFRKSDYPAAADALEGSAQSDLDKLVEGVMKAWSMAGAGDGDGAVSHLDALDGPEWYKLFVSHHKALILEQHGSDAAIRKAYAGLVADMASAGAAPDTYLRGIEAYARYLARQGDKDAALKVLADSRDFVTGRLQVDTLEEDITNGAPVAPLISSTTEGAGEILYNMGSALNRGGGEAFVRLYLQYALALRPADDTILLQLGGVAEAQNKPETAIDYFEKVSENSPLKKIAELQLGLNLADLKRHDEAVEHLRYVMAADPDDMRAYLALGGVYASQKDYAKAAEVYEEAVARIEEPARTDWNIFYQRGIAYERLKEWDKAEPNFRKALELFPDQPQVLNYLGYSWVDMGRNLDEGLQMIAKAVEQRPSDGYIVDSLGWAYYKLGRYDEAVRELERAVSLMPNDPVLNDHLGDAYWRVGRRLEATFQWSHARDMDPEPDVLEAVTKKLAEGLPAEENPSAAEKPGEAPVSPRTELTPDMTGRQGG